LPYPTYISSINQDECWWILVVFHSILVPNFTDVFLVKAIVAQRVEYLAEELSIGV
jgi:hypothetical protein